MAPVITLMPELKRVAVIFAGVFDIPSDEIKAFVREQVRDGMPGVPEAATPDERQRVLLDYFALRVAQSTHGRVAA